MRTAAYALALAAAVLLFPPRVSAAPLGDADYAAYGAVLKAYVRGGWVDYRDLQRNDAGLRAFLKRAGQVTQADYASMDAAAKKAFLINLYNAATLQLIVDHYPVKSIKDIGSFFRGPWDQAVVPLFGGLSTLHHVENDMLRKMGDPRIHFAIVCASKGCPRLSSVAYVPAKLDGQLDAAARLFLHEKGKNEVNVKTGKVRLSPIFRWFKGDFTAKAGSVAAFIAPFLSPREAALVRRKGADTGYFSYDWALNERPRGSGGGPGDT